MATGFGGFGGFGQRAPEYTADELIAAAVSQGGELGRAAERLQNPKKAFFATMTEKSAGALDSFVSTLLTPMYSIAGLLDPNQSIADAIRNRTSPGEVLMTRPDIGASKGEKAAYQVKKFAVDTLLDPLTYLTFGASKGIVGLTKGTQFLMGKEAAQVAGKKADMYGYFTKAGDEQVNKLYQSKLEGLRHTYLKNERVKMANKGMQEADIVKELTRLDNTVSDSLIKSALNSNIDKRWAAKTIGNMIEKYPHLAKEWVDKGGIKWAGMTLLSAQRIKAVGAVLPGMTMLDRAMQPVRGAIGGLFSTKYSGGERMTDKMVELREASRLMVQSQTGHLVRHGARLKNQLKLSDQEWEFVSAAIEKGMQPRDPRAADVWKLAFGEAPTNGTIREEVWQGMLGVERMLGDARDSLIKTGMKLPDHENYLTHFLVREDVSGLTGRMAGKLTQTSDQARFARISTLIDDQGNRFPVRLDSAPGKDGRVLGTAIKEGKEVQMSFQVINSTKEIEKLEAVAKARAEKITESLTQAIQAVKEGTEKIKGTMATRLTDSVLKKLDIAPGLTKADKDAIAGAVSKVIDDASIEKIVGKRMSRFYKNGLKLADGQTAKAVDLEKLAQDIVMAKSDATEIASRINKLLATGPKLPHAKTVTLTAKAKADKEVMKLAKEMKGEADAIRKATLERKLDTKGVENLLEQIVARTSKNPVGLNRVIDSIISNKQLARELKEELRDISRSVEIGKEELTELGGKFLSDTGKAYTRSRASILEARELGINFEPNALATALMASKDAIDTTAARVFVKDVAENFGVRASSAPPGWVAMSDLGMKIENTDVARFLTTKNGEDIFFHPKVAEQVQDFAKTLTKDENIAGVLKAYDAVQNYFKAAVTSIWPAFHGRNALSNIFLMYNKIGAEVLNPVNHIATANFLNMERKIHSLQKKMVKSDKYTAEYVDLMTRTVFTDKTGYRKRGYRWSYGELRTQMMNQVVAFHPRNVGMTDQLRFGVKEVHEAKKLMFPKTKKEKALAAANSGMNPFNSDNHLFKGGFKVGQTIEDYSRTLTFLAQMRHTGDPIQAAQITKQALFDYSNLTNFEKEVMRRIVPFYSFSRKNIELQVSTLLTNPGKMSQQIRAVQTVGDAVNGEQLTEEEMKALPDWAKEGYNLATKREGSHVTLLKTLGTPVEELFNRTSAHANISMISPLIKAPLEFGMGYSTFHGRPISQVTQADAYQYAPKFLQDFIGYEEVKYKDSNGKTQSYHTSFRPEMMYLINTLQPSGRLLSEINRIEKAPNAGAKLGALLFGFGVREFDIERELEKREKERIEELEELLQQAGLGYKFTRYVHKKPQDIVE